MLSFNFSIGIGVIVSLPFLYACAHRASVLKRALHAKNMTHLLMCHLSGKHIDQARNVQSCTDQDRYIN